MRGPVNTPIIADDHQAGEGRALRCEDRAGRNPHQCRQIPARGRHRLREDFDFQRADAHEPGEASRRAEEVSG